MALRTPLTAQPHLYIGDSTGRPLDYGRVYFGEPNKDPEFYPIDIYLDPEMTIAAAQPVRTKGGFMDVGGNLAELHAAEFIYSLKVLDQYGRQVFYKPEMYRNNVSDFLADEIIRATAAETLIAGNLTAETQRAIAAEKVIADAVVTEKDRAIAAEGALDSKYATLDNTVADIINGRPTTAFATKALMEASELVDGDYAIVTDDTVNNGLYVKSAEAWVKSDYDPLTQAKTYVDESKTTIPFTLISGTSTILADFKFSEDTIEHSALSLGTKNGEVRTASQTISLDPSRTSWNTQAVLVDTGTLLLSVVAVGDLTTEIMRDRKVLYYFNEAKAEIYTVYPCNIDGKLVGSEYEEPVFLAYALPTSVQPLLADFKFDTDVIEHLTIRVMTKEGAIDVTAQNIALSTSRIKTGTNAVLLDLETRTLSVRRVTSIEARHMEGKHVLYFFNEELKKVYTDFPYKVNGSDLSELGDKSLVGSLDFTLAAANISHLADFKFSSNTIEHFSVRVLTKEGAVHVPSQNISLSDSRVASYTYTVLVDLSTLTLSALRSNKIEAADMDGKYALYSFNESSGKVYTHYPYKIEGVEVNAESGNGNDNGNGGGGEGNGLSLTDTVIFNDAEPPSLLVVADSHTASDPLPLSGAFDTSNLKPATVYGWYDALLSSYPNYITKELLGNDESGQYPIYSYRFSPTLPNTEGSTTTTPRVFICSIHAETLNFVYPYVMLREICESWKTGGRLAALRHGVEFLIIPCAHPYGMEQKTRLNVNGVDINRNFPIDWALSEEGSHYSGLSPASESETQIVVAAVRDFKPHAAFDCHSFSGEPTRFIWVNTLDQRYRVATQTAALQVYQRVLPSYPLIEGRSFENFYLGSERPGRSNGLSGFFFKSEGAIGSTMEIARGGLESPYLSNTEIVIGASALMNITYESLKAYKLYGKPVTSE